MTSYRSSPALTPVRMERPRTTGKSDGKIPHHREFQLAEQKVHLDLLFNNLVDNRLLGLMSRELIIDTTRERPVDVSGICFRGSVGTIAILSEHLRSIMNRVQMQVSQIFAETTASLSHREVRWHLS